jgi:hypothetical protein
VHRQFPGYFQTKQRKSSPKAFKYAWSRKLS